MKTAATKISIGSISRLRQQIPVRHIEDEAKINAFLRRQTTLVIGSKGADSISLARKLLKEKSPAPVKRMDMTDGVVDMTATARMNTSLLRYIQKSERIIVSTEKQRSLVVHSLVVAMKTFKVLHETADIGTFLLKKALVNWYGFLIGHTNLARASKFLIMTSLDMSVFSSEFFRLLSLKAQRELLKRNYYYKECVFSEDLLHTIARELSKEIELGRLECKVQMIQGYLKVSYRQAYKIYELLKQTPSMA